MSGEKNKSNILIPLFSLLVLGGVLWYASQLPVGHSFTAATRALLKPEPPRLSVLIVGDMMFDRNVRNAINKIGFDEFFKGVKNLLITPDITIGNLEGPFTTYPSKTASLISKELVFTFDPALAPKLAEIGFDILGLANNHTFNFGREGFEMTKKYISAAGMVSYGDPNNKDAISVVFEKKGITIGVIGFHEFHYVNFDKVVSEIGILRPHVDFLIVTPHWGPEYQTVPTRKMKELAHLWIDEGADAVIGTHPHVIADIEEYKEKKIFYSLGNFVFDQYFSKETSEGLVVGISLEKQSGVMSSEYTLTRVAIDKQGVTVLE